MVDCIIILLKPVAKKNSYAFPSAAALSVLDVVVVAAIKR